MMFCSFEGGPLILRLYGSGRAIHQRDPDWDKFAKMFPEHVGTRQFFEIDIDMVQTSCGFQVPFFDYAGERDLLEKWADKKGREGIEQYWEEKNKVSVDGKPTDI